MSGRTGKKWGNNEWDKKKYEPKNWGKFIFYNVTRGHKDTPNGQDITLTVGSKKVRLAPGESYAYQTKRDEVIRVKAKGQLAAAGQKSAEFTIRDTRLLEDHHWWLQNHKSAFGLTFSDGGRPAPRH
jgi:hypothetical protein